MDERLALLERIPLFAEVPRDILGQIAAIAEEQDVAEGKALTHEGRHEGYFYVIVSGSVRIVRGGRVINMLGPGEFLGGIALLDGGPRTATATTAEPTRLLSIGIQPFHDLLETLPPVRAAILEAAGRHLQAIDDEAGA